MGNNNKIIIIGAGPAGISAAIHLANRGYTCTLIDKSSFPRDKVCGDALSGVGLEILESFNILGKVKKLGYRCSIKELYPPETSSCTSFITDSTSKQIQSDSPITLKTETIVIPRKTLDNILLTKAIELGVEFSVGVFSGILYFTNNIPGGIHVSTRPMADLGLNEGVDFRKMDRSLYDYRLEVTDPETSRKKYFDAKYLILATGCQSDQPFSYFEKANIVRPDQIAYRGYYKAEWPVSKRKYFFLEELNPGYLWVFPLGHNVFNIGCGGKILKARKLHLKECLENFINETNTTYKCTGKWMFEPKGAFLRTNFSNLAALKPYPNIIAAGEAMGSTYPFSGGGIGKAMNSGIIAAQAVINMIEEKNSAKTLYKEYAKSINKEMKPSYYTAFKICNYLLTKTPLEKFIYNRVFKNSKTQNVITDIMCKRTTPKSICSIKNIMKLLLKF